MSAKRKATDAPQAPAAKKQRKDEEPSSNDSSSDDDSVSVIAPPIVLYKQLLFLGVNTADGDGTILASFRGPEDVCKRVRDRFQVLFSDLKREDIHESCVRDLLMALGHVDIADIKTVFRLNALTLTAYLELLGFTELFYWDFGMGMGITATNFCSPYYVWTFKATKE